MLFLTQLTACSCPRAQINNTRGCAAAQNSGKGQQSKKGTQLWLPPLLEHQKNANFNSAVAKDEQKQSQLFSS